MANQLPNDLYSGYAQVVNTQPSLQFAARLLAQREAKRDAMDKYLQDATSRVTTTGMRDQEIEPLMQAKSNVQKYYLSNRDKLRNNDAKTMLEWKSLLNTMQDIAQSSIAASKPSKDLRTLFLNKPDLVDRMDEQSTMPMIDKNEQPTHIIENGRVVRNQNYEPLDPTKVIYNPKEYEGKDWDAHTFKQNQFFKPDNVVTDTIPNPKDPYRQIDITSAIYTPEKLNAIADWNIQKYSADPSLRYSFNKSHGLINTPIDQWELNHVDEYDRLNDIYKAAKGKDIETPDELFAATQLEPLTKPTITQKSVDNYGAKSGLQLDQALLKMKKQNDYILGRMRTAQGYKEALIDYRQAKTTEAQDGVLNKFIDNTFDSGTNRFADTSIKKVTVDGKDYTGRVVELPKTIKNEYAVYEGKDDKGNDKFHVPEFYLTDDKKYVIPLYEGDKTTSGGNLLPHTKPIPIQNLKVSLSKLLLTKTATGGEVVDEFDIEDGSAPAPKKVTTTKEVHKKITTATKKDPLGLF